MKSSIFTILSLMLKRKFLQSFLINNCTKTQTNFLRVYKCIYILVYLKTGSKFKIVLCWSNKKQTSSSFHWKLTCSRQDMVIKNEKFNIYNIKFDAEEEILTKLSSCFFPRLFIWLLFVKYGFAFYFYILTMQSLGIIKHTNHQIKLLWSSYIYSH
jgi:hypothetical protein